MKELKIWLLYTGYAFQQTLSNRVLVLLFLFGKSVRIGLFLVFLLFLFQGTKEMAGYNRDQIIFFYLSYNLIDTLGQLIYREVYRFRPLVISGGLDFVLLKPINPLIRVLLGGADVLDLIMLMIIISITFWFGISHITTNFFHWLLYLALVVNGLIIATAFHIFVLGVGVVTTAVDHMIFVYRDLISVLRIPADLYMEPFRFLITFVLLLGVMITFPPKALMGLLSPGLLVFSFLVSLTLMYISLLFWRWSLKQYSSASS